jgi:hypothetical protein
MVGIGGRNATTAFHTFAFEVGTVWLTELLFRCREWVLLSCHETYLNSTWYGRPRGSHQKTRGRNS